MNMKTLQSSPIYKGKVFTVRQDQVQLPSGKIARLDIVQHHGAVVILPFEDNLIWFVRQYRHAAGEVLLELPAGTLEPSEDGETCAYREIREEIGMAAGQLKRIGEFFLAPGYSTEYLQIFIARDLTPAPLPQDEDEQITVEKIPVEEAYQMAFRGELRDAKTLAALLLAQPLLIGR